MDDYRGRYDTGGRRDARYDPPPPPPPEPEPDCYDGNALTDLFGDYLPIILIVAVVVGIYLLSDKKHGKPGSLLGSIFK